MHSMNNKLKTLGFMVFGLALLFVPALSQAQQFRALVISKTAGFRHQSIPEGVAAIKKLGEKHRFQVYASEDASLINDKNLERYDVIILMSTTGTIFNAEEKAAFERFVQSGKGVVGVHSATDTEYEWPWYTKLIGGQFNHHPQQQTARMKVVNRDHPATYHLNDKWLRTDEWYEFKNFNESVNILVQLDETSYEVGERNGQKMGMGAVHPISWYHEYDGGRVFYTGLGHVEEAFEDADFLNHLYGGIWYAALGKPF
ncbi:ThuA domain-containing protein [Cyclobacterium xiamenense]|uniref:ThuA domain-containing protein n=1 Tax=Cyclobacterium xiamenense TaxID=1297121 RepID=UPI0012B79BE4|nr:ThuA domain-containing protein [Cyclobacterium xiamenense]